MKCHFSTIYYTIYFHKALSSEITSSMADSRSSLRFWKDFHLVDFFFLIADITRFYSCIVELGADALHYRSESKGN